MTNFRSVLQAFAFTLTLLCHLASPLSGYTAIPESILYSGATSQTSNQGSSYTSEKAMDGDIRTYSQTLNEPGSSWQVTLASSRIIDRIEINGLSPQNINGLTVELLDDNEDTLLSRKIVGADGSGNWSLEPNIQAATKTVRVGLKGQDTNGAGNYQVTLYEVRLFSGKNLALGKDSYMVRYQDNLPPASNANDDDYSTIVYTTDKTVDGYWEVDLDEEFAVYGVRVIPAEGFESKVGHCTVRLFDDAHDSVWSRPVSRFQPPAFKVELDEPYVSRYVRVGLENKERTSPTGGIEWYLGFAEIQVFGRPVEEVGILNFSSSEANIEAGNTVTLSWSVGGINDLQLFPGIGSVLEQTDSKGNGSIEIMPEQSVAYRLVGRGGGRVYSYTVPVVVDAEPLPVQITEFMAENSLTLEDSTGEYPDWIELFNPGSAGVNLKGYHLSDDAADPRKWAFPNVDIAPGAYVLVYASGRDAPPSGSGEIHVPWRLENGGEDILFSDPGGQPIDQILGYPPMTADLAYGRTLEGVWAFMEPTPGQVNHEETYEGWLKPLVFSQERGFFESPFELTIYNPNPDAQVAYSVTGATPNIIYTSPIPISSTTTVQARVDRAGFKSPPFQTHSYLSVERTLASPVMNSSIVQDSRYADRIRQGMMDLPSVSVFVRVLPDNYVERECSVEVFLPGEHPPIQATCGIERFGGAWTNFSKKNYRLKFRGELGTAKLKAPLFEGFDHGFPVVDVFDELELRAGSHDMESRGFYMAARFVEDTMLDMGSINPHGRFVHLYVNGTYWGQYHLRERLVDHFLADYLGGSPEDYFNVRGNDNVGSSFIPGTPEPAYRDYWEYIRENRGSYEAVKDYIDVPHLIDFMLVWYYGDAETEYRSAGPAGPGSGFKFWLGDADGFLRTGALGKSPTNPGPGDLFGALVREGHPDFKVVMADRIHQHFSPGGALSPERNRDRLDQRMEEIQNSLIAECARWGYRTPDNWVAASEQIKNQLFPIRSDQLLGALRGQGMYPSFDPPEFNLDGGLVEDGFELTMSSGAGTVYYTLDGSDPRLPGGGISPSAKAYQSDAATVYLIEDGAFWRYWDQGGPIDGAWKNSEFDDSSWSSGRGQLGYGDGDEQTVLDYGPDSGNKYITYYFRKSFEIADPSKYDQIQVGLLRDDAAAVYLNGEEIIRNNLPDGSITHETTASNRVGGSEESQFFNYDISPDALFSGTNVIAVEVHQFSGSSTDMSFDFRMSARWSTEQDTVTLHGDTLVKSRVFSGSEWSAITEAHFYTEPEVMPNSTNLQITEIHYNPPGDDDSLEFIEIFNSSQERVRLDGCYLTGGVRFVVPDGTIIEPQSFAVIVENIGAFSGFYLNPESPAYSGEITILGEWSGRLANEGESISFRTSGGAEIASVSYDNGGEWPDRADGGGSSLEVEDISGIPVSQPEKDLWLSDSANWAASSLRYGSPGRFDPFERTVFINEIMVHPLEGEDWIELFNSGEEDIDLAGLFITDDPEQPLKFQFSSGVIIPAGAFLQLSSGALGFDLDDAGSELLLVELRQGRIYRYWDTLDYSPVQPGETLGRFIRTDGRTDFTELRADTPLEGNALPRVGPVVISEVMYSPVFGKGQYVEITNISPTSINMNGTSRPEDVWNLSGAIDFTFPEDFILEPGNPVVICSNDPQTFRAQYPSAAGKDVLGPWYGYLDQSSGSSITLKKSGPPMSGGQTAYYRMDRVRYGVSVPWPVPGTVMGTSIVRLPLESYGNDPSNWVGMAGGDPGAVPANRAPHLEWSAPAKVAETGLVDFIVSAVDPDAPWQNLVLSVADLPAGANFTPETGRFFWAPGESDGPNEFSITFSVSDDGYLPESLEKVYALEVLEINEPPVIEAVGDLTIPAGTLFQWKIPASDPDLPAQSLAYSQTGLPPGLELNKESGEVFGIPDHPGLYPVSLTVSDQADPPLMDSRSFMIEVIRPLRIQINPLGGDGIHFSVEIVPGEAYQIEYCDNLLEDEWKLLETIPTAEGGLYEWTDPLPSGVNARFYRIRWLRNDPTNTP